MTRTRTKKSKNKNKLATDTTKNKEQMEGVNFCRHSNKKRSLFNSMQHVRVQEHCTFNVSEAFLVYNNYSRINFSGDKLFIDWGRGKTERQTDRQTDRQT